MKLAMEKHARADEEYRFVTRWRFDAPVERVWAAITDVERYPDWWPGVLRATVLGAEKTLRVGQVTEVAVRGALPYTLHFRTEVVEFAEPLRLILHSSGELSGRGEWRLTTTGSETEVTYLWEVRLVKPGFGFLSSLPFVRRLLARKHDRVMAQGYSNLCRLLASEE
jgi:uncharacterized protein YndB with AHSA1/START domain